MTIEEVIVENLRELPPEKQQEVLDFVQSLTAKPCVTTNRRSIKGICADLGVHLTLGLTRLARKNRRVRDAMNKFERSDKTCSVTHQFPM
ncbi:MAG: DUF2281 domain-containing protein [Calothrix sp. FI2-JRJ7]|jgi:hypothetical protein|nr:DUF2281 domain-containing protein [Calothrix sp. FI2-JRJ7]